MDKVKRYIPYLLLTGLTLFFAGYLWADMESLEQR